MTLNGWGRRTVTLTASHALVAVICVLALGVLVGLNLPFGSKPVTVARGMAEVNRNGGGSFQADHGGVTAYLPHEVTWTDGTGTTTSGGVPTCLRREKNASVSAAVEAGYVEVRSPGGSGGYLVAWIRCL